MPSGMVGDTKVFVEHDGLTNIADLVPHDINTIDPWTEASLQIKIKNHAGVLARTLKWWYIGVREVYKLSLESGEFICCTWDQELLVRSDLVSPGIFLPLSKLVVGRSDVITKAGYAPSTSKVVSIVPMGDAHVYNIDMDEDRDTDTLFQANGMTVNVNAEMTSPKLYTYQPIPTP